MDKISQPKRRFGRLAATVGAVVIVGAAALAVSLHWQRLVDQFVVWQYQPSAEIVQFATDSGMNDHGRFYFYASQPELNDSADFNNRCPDYEQMVVLGCYTAGKIFLYNVNDERLAGIKSVTAAHEMLHAAYERLDSGQRARVNDLVEQQLVRTTDQRLLDLIKSYDETEPGQRLNEFHSIFGTEVAELSPELEKYYSQYFADRSKVVAAHRGYQLVFDDLRAQQDSLSQQLRGLETEITAAEASYNAATAQLSTDINNFNQRAARVGGFSDEAEFEIVRAELLTRQADLADELARINAQITEYNRTADDLNALGVEAERLQTSLDSRAPAIDDL
jgi:hypothetical protein